MLVSYRNTEGSHTDFPSKGGTPGTAFPTDPIVLEVFTATNGRCISGIFPVNLESSEVSLCLLDEKSEIESKGYVIP